MGHPRLKCHSRGHALDAAAAATAASSWFQRVLSSAKTPLTACSWRRCSKTNGRACPARRASSLAATTCAESAEANQLRQYADARSLSFFVADLLCPRFTLLRDCGGGSGALLESARGLAGGMALGELANLTLATTSLGLLLWLLRQRY